MGFQLNAEQQHIQEAVRDFVKCEFDKELIIELESKYRYPVGIWKKAADLGFVGIHFPEKYSGQGLGVMENILAAEEFCRGDSTVGACLCLADYASEILIRFGSEKLKSLWLPKVAEGEVLSCGVFTEQDHDSDISTMGTTAKRVGGQWVIDGSKIFITNGGPMAGFYSVLCRTDPEAQPSHRGLSLIFVEASRPGVSTTDVGIKMGIRMMQTAEVNFKNVRVPVTNLIGEANRGFYHVLDFFDESRILIAAQALGTAQGAFDRALAYVKSKTQFGKKNAEFHATRHKLVDMATKIELARLITYQAAWSCDQGRIISQLTSMAKMVASRAAVEVCDEAIQLLGGYGHMLEYEVERFARDAKIAEMFEGTQEIQKNTIADCLIGKAK